MEKPYAGRMINLQYIMVSVRVAENSLVLGQLKIDDKSNEITAIPEFIKSLALQGSIITIDVMGCQKKITETIIAEKADYIIQIKSNQRNLHNNISLFFQDPANGPFDSYESIDGDHGRIETRNCSTTSDIDWLEVSICGQVSKVSLG